MAAITLKNLGKKSLKWESDPSILRRLEQVEQLVLSGYNNLEIAKTLKIAESTVLRDRRRIALLWRKLVASDIREMRGRSIAYYRKLQKSADLRWRGTGSGEGEVAGVKDVNLLTLQMNTENRIVELQGTKTPVAQLLRIDQVESEMDLRNIPTADIIKRAQQLEDLAIKLLAEDEPNGQED